MPRIAESPAIPSAGWAVLHLVFAIAGDRTDEVHGNMLKLAIRSARVVNMKLAGVDIICEDISLDPADQKTSFLETNNFPSLSIHYEPSIGKPRRVAKDILEDIFTGRD